ncbi:hypothetical protein DL768_011247 [Monosporascus sp. mg162]|nr:hypothetical protein DL768_011247 [Monosporascus sp. mg162]
MSSSGGLPPDIASQNKGTSVVASTTAVVAISTVTVLARLYVSSRMRGKLHLDDYLISFAAVCAWLTIACTIVSVHSGTGQHLATLTKQQISGAVLWTMVGFVPGVLSFAVPKLAVVALLVRLLNPSKTHRNFLWFLSGSCILVLMGCIAILFGQCIPSRSQWDFSIIEKTCIDPYVLVDYSIFAGASKDPTYETADLTVWTCVEGSTIISAACIPILRPLADKFLGRQVFSSMSKRRGYRMQSSERSGGPSSDFELGSNRRKARKHPHHLDTLAQTAQNDSQEIIATKANDNQQNIIVRTQSIVVSYSDGDGDMSSSGYSWK